MGWTAEQLRTVKVRRATVQAGAGVERRTSLGRAAVTADVKLPRPVESSIEAMFALQLRAARLPEPKREFAFCEGRKFRLDFAWPERLIAVEVQGMVHRIKERFEADIEKRALALLGGWRVLEVSGQAVRDGRALGWIEQLLQPGD
jgi:very-short-patch-repair endonuclease